MVQTTDNIPNASKTHGILPPVPLLLELLPAPLLTGLVGNQAGPVPGVHGKTGTLTPGAGARSGVVVAFGSGGGSGSY